MSIISSNHRLVKVEGAEYSAGSGIDITNNIISVDPNLSAVIDDKLDISTFSSYSATVDEELQYVSANAGNTYSAGDNIDIYEQDNDLYISAKDWTTDIANASSYAFNEATAQIPTPFDPTYISGQIDNKLNKSDFETYSGTVNTQISGLSGEIQTTSSVLNNKITAVRNDLNTVSTNTGYLYNDIQTTSGILSGAIDYVSANVGDEFPASANEAITAYQTNSGTYLTAHQDLSYISGQIDNKLDLTAFNITASGSWNESTNVVQNNSAAWFDNVGDAEVNNFVYDNSATINDVDTSYIQNSGTFLTAHQDISNKLDTTAFSTVSGTFLTAHQDLSNYATTGDLNNASGILSGAIDYVSGAAITAHQDLSYISGQVDNKLDTTAFSTVSGTFLTAHQIIPSAKWEEASTEYEQNSGTYLTAHQDISNKLDTTAFSTVSGTFLTAHQPISANEWNSVYDTVEANSGSWTGGGGGSIDTIPVTVISPLVTGFSGESAYLGIESTALNLSSYVPVSSIGYNGSYISNISGKSISSYTGRYAMTANYANTADRAYHDRNNNEITSYYQPKLTITGDAGTITSINGSAVGASIPEGWELVAGAGISIVDDAENNQTIISAAGGGGGNPEVESYVQTNSASIDDAVSTYQTNSATYLTSHQAISANEWNSNYETVNTNSSTWGEVTSKQDTLTFGYDTNDAISSINSSSISDSRQGTDLYVQYPLFTGTSGTSAYIGWNNETVLWSGTMTWGQNGSLTDSVKNYERIRFYIEETNRHRKSTNEMVLTDLSNANLREFSLNLPDATTGYFGNYFTVYSINEAGTSITSVSGRQWWYNPWTSTAINGSVDRGLILKKVVGINRKENA